MPRLIDRISEETGLPRENLISEACALEYTEDGNITPLCTEDGDCCQTCWEQEEKNEGGNANASQMDPPPNA